MSFIFTAILFIIERLLENLSLQEQLSGLRSAVYTQWNTIQIYMKNYEYEKNMNIKKLNS